MDVIKLNIASEFSRTPGARYIKEGEYSGELFRTKYLLPKMKTAINDDKILEVILDGSAGYGTSFLEESFGGLIRDGITYEHVKKYLRIVSNEDSSYIEEINEYIEDANRHEAK